MKVVLIADPHIEVGGGLVRGIESSKRLDTCVRRINELAEDADLCVLLGDSVHTPSEEAYRTFLHCLKPLKMPIRFLVGNHDDRKMFLAVRPDLPCDQNGFFQSTIETNDALLLFLDTHKEGSDCGDYCPEKLAWVKQRLFAARGKPAYLFMHHPPVKIGVFNDYSIVAQSESFLEVLREAGNVRHMFLGHVHRASSGNWNGIAWSTLHGIAYQNDFELAPAKPNYRSGPAQIGILLINGNESALHFQDILDPYPLIAYSGRSLRAPEPVGQPDHAVQLKATVPRVLRKRPSSRV
jgi:3',5'-cyclic-AMP phosphodiesterase